MSNPKSLKCGHHDYWINARGYKVCKECHRINLYKWRHQIPKETPTYELVYSAWLNNRIDEAKQIGLPMYYIAGLEDARKIFMAHNPLLELVA